MYLSSAICLSVGHTYKKGSWWSLAIQPPSPRPTNGQFIRLPLWLEQRELNKKRALRVRDANDFIAWTNGPGWARASQLFFREINGPALNGLSTRISWSLANGACLVAVCRPPSPTTSTSITRCYPDHSWTTDRSHPQSGDVEKSTRCWCNAVPAS